MENYQIITDMGILADVAYSEYGEGEFIDTGEVISANEDGSHLLNTSYTVIDYADTATSMQAILLEKNDVNGNATGDYVIAFRGTQEKLDIVVDGLTGLVNYNPQVSDAKDFVQQMMVKYGISANKLSLTEKSIESDPIDSQQ